MQGPFKTVMRFLKAIANHHLRVRNGDKSTYVAPMY